MESRGGSDREGRGGDDEALAALAVALRAERWRRVGILIMYSPAFFLAILVGLLAPAVLINGAGAPPPASQFPGWLEALLIGVLAGMMLSLLACPFGVVLRAASAGRVERLGERFAFEELPQQTPVRTGERLGVWVVRGLAAAPVPAVELHIELAPPALWRIFAWGFSGFLLLCIAMTIAQGGGPFVAICGFGFFGAFYFIFFADRRARAVGGPAAGVELVTTWHPLLPRRRVRVEAARGGAITLAGDSVIVADASDRAITFAGFAPGSLGRWQAARLAGVLRCCLDAAPEEPPGTASKDAAERAAVPF